MDTYRMQQPLRIDKERENFNDRTLKNKPMVKAARRYTRETLQAIMKKLIIYTFLVICSTFSFGQSSEKVKLQEWIKTNNIVFNSPSSPEGFEHFINCNDMHAYRKTIGDTIIIYSRGSSVAENIKTLKKTIKKENFNVLCYPTRTQNNGTIIIQYMRKWTFLKKNEALYLLDDYDKRKDDEFGKILTAWIDKKITDSEFQKQVKENENKDFGFVPQFKMIYFKGIFDNSNVYKFKKNQNFKEEKVTLLRTWNHRNKKYYKINLKTWTAGKYVISEDFEFINTEICEE
ncbi:hypothetical protein [Marinifilum fragile]|uniref:hypothetical protein n=1 Tax=Marinifilum fragile TaxID=570161 RepID=UPI0012F7FA91|nr:hypothetical protein [Marinifilum fragile]